MTDTSVFLFINGLAGKVPAIDEFFKGISNDYFPLVTASLLLLWIWFGSRDSRREENQRGIIAAIISIGLVSGLVAISNGLYDRPRPFEALPPGSVNLLFYRPTDSSFPSNLAAVFFAIAVSIFIKNRKYGAYMLALAILSSFGRVYMGIHYPLDALGGAGIGAISGFMAFGIARLIRPATDYVLQVLQRYSLA